MNEMMISVNDLSIFVIAVLAVWGWVKYFRLKNRTKSKVQEKTDA